MNLMGGVSHYRIMYNFIENKKLQCTPLDPVKQRGVCACASYSRNIIGGFNYFGKLVIFINKLLN